MAITIENTGASLKITNGTEVRHITKSQILEVAVIKTTIIKLDIGKTALQNVFISYGDVTIPSTANPAALRDTIANMLTPETGASGGATETKQDTQITKLTDLNTAIASLNTLMTSLDNRMNSMDSKLFFEPRRIDDSGVGTIYKGYSNPGVAEGVAQWAIQRIENVGEVDVYSWADGNKNFDNRWTDRETLAYS
jgi:hypothetical protein